MKSRSRGRRTSKTGRLLVSHRGAPAHTPAAVGDVQTELPARVLAYRLSEEAAPQDRERVEAELRRLTAIVRNSNDAVTIQTFDGEILAWNRGAELMYGYTEAEAVGMSIQEIIPPDLRREAEAFAGRASQGEAVESLETTRLTKNGTVIDVWLTVTTLVDPSGSPEAIATTERDVTPIKEAEETIRVQQAEIAHIGRVQAMGEFAAAMAHELNQPLCAIGTNARAAQRMIDADMPLDEIKEALGDIVQDIERASMVVQGLKDQLRRCEPEYSTLDINEVVSGIAPIAEALGRSEDTSVRFCLGNSLGPVRGDRVQLQQVLLNLIRNGVEAMPETKAPARELTVETAISDGGDVRVSVRDHGLGLSDRVAEHMFEPFFTTKPEGMGMGLAICSSIIAAHRGRLWASQNADGGSTLHFSLPCSQEAGDS
jgi:two-component system sensor kinase FixL